MRLYQAMADTGCFHCGEALPTQPQQVVVDAQPRNVCCSGCAAAASWIRDAGLLDYYRLRSEPGTRADTFDLDLSAWGRLDELSAFLRRDGDALEISLVVEGIRCAACAWLIGQAALALPGVLEAEANAVNARLRLRWRADTIELPRILSRLAELGYRVHLGTGAAADTARRVARRDLLKRLGVAAIGAFQVMMFAEALFLDFDSSMSTATRDFFRWISVLVSTPVVFYAGKPFIDGMRSELSLRRPGMDTLIAGSVLLAWAASLVETLRGGPHVWFDAAVMFILILLFARLLERGAREKAQHAIDRLARAQPALAWRRQPDASLAQVSMRSVVVGDTLHVHAGDAIPADGILESGSAEVDESLISGESKPVHKRAGEALHAGSVALATPLLLHVLATGGATLIARLLHLVETAQLQRPQMALRADRLASRFVLALLPCTLVVAAFWTWYQPERALEVTLALLVVSCPCALSLALPAALAAAHATLARLGVACLDANVLQVLPQIDVVLFDKTGTLTCGDMRLIAVELRGELDREQVLSIAAAISKGSRHPLAAAFDAATDVEANAVHAVAGAGMEAEIGGRRYRLGRPDFAVTAQADDGAVWLSIDGRALARFEIGDQPRPEAAAICAELRERGLQLHIASGDGETAVAMLAGMLGIEHWRARLDPAQKLARLQALQAAGHRVLVVGDGINDAPLLAAADASMAMGGGASLAHRSADMVLLGNDLRRVAQVLRLAGRNRRLMQQNLGWAFAYNLVALPVAALGWVTPLLAAAGMAGSSLLVTANALRGLRTP